MATEAKRVIVRTAYIEKAVVEQLKKDRPGWKVTGVRLCCDQDEGKDKPEIRAHVDFEE